MTCEYDKFRGRSRSLNWSVLNLIFCGNCILYIEDDVLVFHFTRTVAYRFGSRQGQYWWFDVCSSADGAKRWPIVNGVKDRETRISVSHVMWRQSNVIERYVGGVCGVGQGSRAPSVAPSRSTRIIDCRHRAFAFLSQSSLCLHVFILKRRRNRNVVEHIA